MMIPLARRWVEPQEVSVPESVLQAIGGRALVARILVRRGFVDAQAAQDFLEPDSYLPTAATELPDLGRAVERLERAMRERETIAVWGDFDVDGQTATTILVSALRDLGADVIYHIPVRASESHGVNIPYLQSLIERGANLVLTCDTGVSSAESVEYAQNRNVDCIITDHHDLPEVLPRAYALINPKRLVSPSPLSTLSGAGVAYKVAEEMYRRAGRPAAVKQYLDLAALGLVADLAELTRDTRYLVQHGLKALRETQRVGLRVMMELAEVNPAWLSEQDVGFSLGPRLNALGRLDDANLAVELLTTADPDRAREIGTRLEALNAQRKLLTDQVFQGALAQIEREPELLELAALVLSHPSWPAGVVGIVASRLVERYGKPTVLLSAPPGGIARGSARSIQGCNISIAIAENKSMLEGFGGHPMAAGISILSDRIPEFRRDLARSVKNMLGDMEREEFLQIDAYLELDDLSLDLVEDLERLSPFGPGNPPIVLVSKGLSLRSCTELGRTGEHLRLVVENQEGTEQKVIWWQGAGWPLPEGRFDLAYAARTSSFKGERSLRLEWIDARPMQEPLETVRQAHTIDVVDLRQEPHPLPLLRQLQSEGAIQIWAEGESKAHLGGQYRDELEPASALAIWTTPPGPSELQSVIQTVAPTVVYLFGVDPGMDTQTKFLQRLAGLINHILNSLHGRVDLSKLAAAMAHREVTVRLGIEWLVQSGHLSIVQERDNWIQLSGDRQRQTTNPGDVAARLKFMLEETAAYRKYFDSVDVPLLMFQEQGPRDLKTHRGLKSHGL